MDLTPSRRLTHRSFPNLPPSPSSSLSLRLCVFLHRGNLSGVWKEEGDPGPAEAWVVTSQFLHPPLELNGARTPAHLDSFGACPFRGRVQWSSPPLPAAYAEHGRQMGIQKTRALTSGVTV